MAATELAHGMEALKRVTQIFPYAMPLISQDQWGTPIKVEPGTIWGGDRMFITNNGGEVAFTVGDRLYCQNAEGFIRDHYLIALGQGAQKAMWLIPIAQAEMAFLMAFGCTIAGAVGTIAAISVFLGKITVFYTTHKQQVNNASHYIQPLLEGIYYFATRCPKLFWLLTKGLGGQAIQSAGQGITAADVAYFLGKVLGGGLKAAPELALVGLLKVIGGALAISLVVRGPGTVVHGAPNQAKRLIEQLARDGIRISDPEAMMIATEACLKNPEHQRRLREIATNAEKLQPIVDQLSRALQMEQAPQR